MTLHAIDWSSVDGDVSSHAGSEDTGSALIAVDIDGGSCLELNGSSEYATKTIGGYRSGDSLGTMTAWIRLDSAASAYDIILSSADTAGTQYYLNFACDIANMRAYVIQESNGTVDHVATANNTLVAERWHHVALVSDGSGYLIYIDRMPMSLTVVGGSNSGDWFADTSNRDNVQIGVVVMSANYHYFTGLMDDIRVYSSALSAADIAEIALTGEEPDSPVNAWDCSDGSGTTVTDQPGADDLTTQSGAWSTTHPTIYAQRARCVCDDIAT